jgi:hypothetical protein
VGKYAARPASGFLGATGTATTFSIGTSPVFVAAAEATTGFGEATGSAEASVAGVGGGGGPLLRGAGIGAAGTDVAVGPNKD